MVKIRNLAIAAGALFGGLAIAGAAAAAPCAMNSITAAGATLNYDAFSPSGGVTNLPMTLTITRYNPSGGQKTQSAAFYFTTPSTTQAGITITQAATGTTNYLYYSPYTGAPTLANTGTAQPGVIYGWGTAADPDTFTVNALVTIPPGVDFSAGGTIPFGIRYVCKGTGGLTSVDTPTEFSTGLQVAINVLSGLQASFAGPALNFGELGTITPALVSTVTPRTGQINVRSTGPYTVAMTSANGYQMKVGGGGTGIGYTLHFLGQDKTNASPTFTTQSCARATVSGINLPIKATLTGPGNGLPPSSNYKDTLTVTITPITGSVPAPPETCSTIP